MPYAAAPVIFKLHDQDSFPSVVSKCVVLGLLLAPIAGLLLLSLLGIVSFLFQLQHIAITQMSNSLACVQSQ